MGVVGKQRAHKLAAEVRAYRLPDVDPSVFAHALEAYRAAVQHSRRVELKWQARSADLKGADEFSRISISHDNETYRAEQMCSWGRDLLTAAARRGTAHPEQVYDGTRRLFDEPTNAEVRSVLRLLRGACAAVILTKIEHTTRRRLPRRRASR